MRFECGDRAEAGIETDQDAPLGDVAACGRAGHAAAGCLGSQHSEIAVSLERQKTTSFSAPTPHQRLPRRAIDCVARRAILAETLTPGTSVSIDRATLRIASAPAFRFAEGGAAIGRLVEERKASSRRLLSPGATPEPSLKELL
jgi:hypothetical protein